MTATTAPVATPLLAGAAKADITPEDLSGLNPMGVSFTGVHDPIHLRVLVLADERTRIALVSMDVVEIGDTRELRRRIETETGIPADHVLIAASHTHNAPRVGHVSPGAAALAMRPEFETFTTMVEERLVRAVLDAIGALRPARVGSGSGVADVNVNRDEFRDGEWIHGVQATGPSDKTVGVLRVDAVDGGTLAIVVNYGVHSTVTLGTGHLGADLAGAAASYIEERVGGGAVALWTCGALGDQAPRISLGGPSGGIAEQHTDASIARAHREADAQGIMVGAAAVSAATAIETLRNDAVLAAAAGRIEFASRGPASTMDDQSARSDRVGLPLTVLRIGPVILAGFGGEAVGKLLVGLRERSPLRETFVVSLANDRIGYLVDEESAAKRTFEAHGCPLVDPAADRVILSALEDLIATTVA